MLTLRIDPWAASYESAMQIEDDEPPASVEVDPRVETDDWCPREPEDLPPPDSIAFIDGVQRIELRVIGDDDGRMVHGAFASIGVGAAIMRPVGASSISPQLAQRIIALGGGASCPPWKVPCGTVELTFRAESSSDGGADAWQKALRNARRDAEQALGRTLVGAGHPLVIIDGRLTFQPSERSHAVGVAKTIRTVYLEPPYSAILRELRPGTRTPLFALKYEHEVFSWYIRLTQPRLMEHEWAGLVQVETMAGIGREQAVRLADLTARYLPSFASDSSWDARAPQNTLPVAALEHRLRHELGDHEWVRRNLEAHFYRRGGLS